MFFFTKQAQRQVDDLRSSLEHQRKRYQHLLEHVQTLAQDKRTLQRALAMLGHQLRLTETGRDAIQKWGNDNLEEMRSLRRLDNVVRRYVADRTNIVTPTVFMPQLKEALRDVDSVRAKRSA